MDDAVSKDAPFFVTKQKTCKTRCLGSECRDESEVAKEQAERKARMSKLLTCMISR